MNVRRQAKVTVNAAAAGHRLDVWLARRFTYHSRHQWQALIKQQRILVNDVPVPRSRSLRCGDRVEYIIDTAPAPMSSTPVPRCYSDDFLIVVNKPAGLTCHPAGSFFTDTLWFRLQQESSTFRIVNRLDRETSGALVVARSRTVAAHLNRQFSNRTVGKTYLTIVRGRFPPDLTADGYLVPDCDSQVRKKQRLVSSGHGQRAITEFKRLSTSNGLSLLLAIPRTGRRHQIRASLCSLGFPVIGDKLYGDDDTQYLRYIGTGLSEADHTRLRLPRQALHAMSLRFRHPDDGREICTTAPLPSDLTTFLMANGMSLTVNALLNGLEHRQ